MTYIWINNIKDANKMRDIESIQVNNTTQIYIEGAVLFINFYKI